MAFSESLVNENQELVKKLAAVVSADDVEDELRAINYLLKQKIAKQQTAQGEVADPIGVSPKDMKVLRKAFNKFDKDGSGSIDAAELSELAAELAEPLTEEEIAEGMKEMDKAGTGVISFDDFVKWISDERDKDSQRGMKMRMLKLKMRASHLSKKAGAELKRTSTFSKDWDANADDVISIGAEVIQGEVAEVKTQVDVKWSALSEEEGRAAMSADGVPEDGAASITVNIELLEGIGAEAEGELSALYDQLFDMAFSDEDTWQEASQGAMIHSKPTLKIKEVDGVQCLQITAPFAMDPISQVGFDSRFLKNMHARVVWAHCLDEALKGPGEQIDVLTFEGIKANAKIEIERKMLEWLSQSDEAKMVAEDMLDFDVSAFVMAGLVAGSVDTSVKVRSITDIFSKEIREGLEEYNEKLTELEDMRMMDADSTVGMLTTKIVEIYSQLPPPVQSIYNEVKAKVAGPHSVTVRVPTGEVKVTTTGLNTLHKFFPTPEEITSHPEYSAEGGDGSDDDEW